MEIRLLGTLEVEDEGRSIEVRRPRERSLLTLLASEAGNVVSADKLIQGIWGDQLPATALKTLQTYVHHLRSLLPKDTIATVSPGYRLDVSSEAVDAHRFLALLTEARNLTSGQARLERLNTALRLWRGTVAQDADEADWIRPFRAHIEEEHLAAQAEAMSLEVTEGHHEEAVAGLRTLLAEHPLREDLWAIYMTALYRGGRQAEALRAFAEVRGRLVDELGIEPGPLLQRLQEQILAQDPALDYMPAPVAVSEEAPRASETQTPGTPRSPEPEQRWVSVLRAEVVGVEQAERELGRETAGRIAAEAVRGMVRTVERHGGSLLDAGETGVLAGFGVPLAQEDDTYRAIHTALRLVRHLAEYGREVARSWGVAGVDGRASVSTTEFTVPLIDSADVKKATGRLLETAAGGMVVVDDHSRQLMGDLFEFDEAGPDGSWVVGAVLGAADKARMGRRLRAPLTGRHREFDTLAGALSALREGVGGIVFVTGEAGVGKTRLIEEARHLEPGSQMTWLVGHCVSYAEASPYWPIRDMVRAWLGLGIDDTDLQARLALRQKIEQVAPDAAADLYPYLGGILGIVLEPEEAERLNLASEALQYRTFEVFTGLLEHMTREEPVVMVVEDLHWADPTSLQLLDQILALTESSAVLVVLTSRSEPDHPSRRVAERARLHHPHRTTSIALECLNEADQRSMLAALVGFDSLPKDLADRVLYLAEGNPFYLEELVGSLIDQGVFTSEPRQGDNPGLVVPETVEKVVQARIDRLDRAPRDVLAAASVLGRSFGLPLLQGVIGESAAALQVMQELLRLDLLVEARRWPQAEYLFRHVLIQEAAYRSLPIERRVELHRQAAEWLERRYEANQDEVVGLLAQHWLAAGDEDKAAEALVRAGDLARKSHALDEAIDHYRRLLPLLEQRDDRRAISLVLFKLALALHEAMRFPESNEAYQRAFGFWEFEPSLEATDTLRFASPPFWLVPDPVRSYMLPDIQLQMALFDRLVERWPDDTLVPSLAESWEISDDGLTYRFHLRDGCTWSDGAPLTALDAEYGIKRNLDPQRPGVSVAMLYVIDGAKDYVFGRSHDPATVGVTAVDCRTLELRLNRPAPYLLGMLNRPDCGPQPRHAIEALGDEWAAIENQVVSGAFRRRSHSGDTVVLDRRPEYRGSRRGNVGVVEWRTASSPENVDSYMNGEVDLAWTGSRWDGKGLENATPGEVRVEPPAGFGYLVLNFAAGRVGDRLFRLALAHAIDRHALAHNLRGHVRVATGGIVPPFLAGHTPDIALRFDPELSRRLLSRADAPGTLRVGIDPRSAAETWSEPAAVVAMWREHLDIEIEVIETELQFRDAADVDVFEAGWYPGYTDPEYFLRLLLHSEASDNHGGFSDKHYDELVERAVAARDERTRLQLFHEADRLAVAEEVALIPLSYSGNITLRRPGLEGWWEHGKSWANFADLMVPPTR